jgi:hypothetical protein
VQPNHAAVCSEAPSRSWRVTISMTCNLSTLARLLHALQVSEERWTFNQRLASIRPLAMLTQDRRSGSPASRSAAPVCCAAACLAV